MATFWPGAEKPFYVMTKPAGSACNMRCEYCYYLEKKNLYPYDPKMVMDDKLLEHFVEEYIANTNAPQVLFTWHGGETLLRDRHFYERALRFQRKHAHGKHIDNCLQTNGILLSDDWCCFLHDNNFLVGISIDGPAEYHDAYRRMRGGQPSHERVMKGIELLNKHQVEWNAMAVVNNLNVKHPLEFYRFFKNIGCQYIQFSPIVERIFPHENGTMLTSPDEQDERIQMAPFSITAREWGEFLCVLFDEWKKEDIGRIFIQLFDATLANWVGAQPGTCVISTQCGHAAVMEWNGDVYSCDHFVFPQFKLGNIKEKTLVEMMLSPQQEEFRKRKMTLLPKQCKECQWLFACNGECPKNRFIRTADGEQGLNYLCEGYKMFFEHSSKLMSEMAGKIKPLSI